MNLKMHPLPNLVIYFFPLYFFTHTAAFNTDSNGFVCSKYVMLRDQWLWLAPQQEEWAPCPLPGGYNFKTYRVTELFESPPYHSYTVEDQVSVSLF